MLPPELVSLSYMSASGDIKYLTEVLHSLSEEGMTLFFQTLALMISSESA